jgi:hypothetical protein
MGGQAVGVSTDRPDRFRCCRWTPDSDGDLPVEAPAVTSLFSLLRLQAALEELPPARP